MTNNTANKNAGNSINNNNGGRSEESLDRNREADIKR